MRLGGCFLDLGAAILGPTQRPSSAPYIALVGNSWLPYLAYNSVLGFKKNISSVLFSLLLV